ncbi:MAG: hypothetical protein IJJ82_07620 [Clostridia bacterium]|nr:hypothetical protein [Clostridia bacterium]
MNEENYKFSIPNNVKIRMEVINGVGIRELIETIVAGIISAVIAVIINAITNNYIISIGFFLLVTGATFVLVMRDKNNNSIAGIIFNIFKFFKGQRYFEFIANESEEEKNEI